jgi:glycosyltransferase involved in cell wall biosynthesis
MYGIKYTVIQNVPLLVESGFKESKESSYKGERYLLYQGAVNEGRCFETLIPAMKNIDCKLLICGDGNFMTQARLLVKQNNVEEKVIFRGNIAPSELQTITQQAFIGINLVENNGLSFYLSLANKFFDYIHAGIPQLCAGYPAYKEINDKYEVAVLITDMSTKNIAAQLNNLLNDGVLYKSLQINCRQANAVYNWQNEEKILIDLYKHALG